MAERSDADRIGVNYQLGKVTVTHCDRLVERLVQAAGHFHRDTDTQQTRHDTRIDIEVSGERRERRGRETVQCVSRKRNREAAHMCLVMYARLVCEL